MDAFLLKSVLKGSQCLLLRALLCTAHICSPDSIFINELEKRVSSEVIKSADVMKLFKVKKTGDHYEELHRELMRLSDWAIKC